MIWRLVVLVGETGTFELVDCRSGMFSLFLRRFTKANRLRTGLQYIALPLTSDFRLATAKTLACAGAHMMHKCESSGYSHVKESRAGRLRVFMSCHVMSHNVAPSGTTRHYDPCSRRPLAGIACAKNVRPRTCGMTLHIQCICHPADGYWTILLAIEYPGT